MSLGLYCFIFYLAFKNDKEHKLLLYYLYDSAFTPY